MLTLPKVLPTKNASILAFREMSVIQAIESDTDLTNLAREGSLVLSMSRDIGEKEEEEEEDDDEEEEEEEGVGKDVVPSTRGTTAIGIYISNVNGNIYIKVLTNTRNFFRRYRTSSRATRTRRSRGRRDGGNKRRGMVR